MAAWQYVGYKKIYMGTNYTYWSNGEDVATLNCGCYDLIAESNMPPADADIEYGVVTYDYDGDVVAWMDDWGITRDRL